MNKLIGYYYLCLVLFVLVQAFSTVFSNNQQLSSRQNLSQLASQKQSFTKEIRDLNNQTAVNQSLLFQSAADPAADFHEINHQLVIRGNNNSLLGSL
jgi:CHASE1-domain containing sensor protein